MAGRMMKFLYASTTFFNYCFLLYFSIILDADPSLVKRVDLRNDDIAIGEQTVAQVTNAIHGLFW